MESYGGLVVDLGGFVPKKNPFVVVWHHLYKLEAINAYPDSNYVVCWPKGRGVLITGLSPSCGDWCKKIFFLDVATYGPQLRRNFKLARVF